MVEKGWLYRQTKLAKKEVDSWPQWLKDIVKFDGQDVHTTKEKNTYGNF